VGEFFNEITSYYSGDPSVLAEDCYEKLQKYIKGLLPKSELKSSFNGGFVYLVWNFLRKEF